jgi:hypothetical protein
MTDIWTPQQANGQQPDPGRIEVAHFAIPAEWAAPMLNDLYQANKPLFGKLVLKRIGADRAGKD